MSDPFSQALGGRLKRARQVMFPSDSQEKFSQRLGVERKTLIRMEQGDLSVAFGTYLAAARLLGCDEPFNELFSISLTLEPVKLPRRRVVGP